MIKDIFKVPVCINKLKLDTKKIETFCTNLKFKQKDNKVKRIISRYYKTR